jgi:uncharacterized Zn finger protein (UPF0148 family)
MKVRGERECKSCGTRWSYYRTGSVTCPECGSMRSVGVDDRTEHTASPAALDLTEVRKGYDDAGTVRETAERAADVCHEYVRQYGFVHAGQLQPLSEVYVGAQELAAVGDEIGRRMRVDDETELYVLELLRGVDDGERPDPESVPDAMRQPRGLAVCRALEAYHRDVTRLRDDLVDASAAPLLERVRDHRKRIEALDGGVDPQDGERLLRAMQDLGAYLIEDDETAFVRAQSRLDELP